MGNQLTGIAPSQIFPVEYYLTDLPDYTYDINLGSTRFFKVARAKHREGLSVVKVFAIRDPSLPLKTHREKLDAIKGLLKKVPNTIPFQKTMLTEKAGILVRQYVKDNLYDRISTRPFLNSIEKRWIAFQLLQCLSHCHELGVHHGDIKLENIMISSWNWVFLTDFASFKPTHLAELPNDMENYMQWKLTKDVKKRLKPGVIPHIFECQRKNVQPPIERTGALKRRRIHLVQEALSEYDVRNQDVMSCNEDAGDQEDTHVPESVPCASASITTEKFLEKSVQVNIKKPFRSKSTNTFISTISVGCSTSIMGINVGTSISPEKLRQEISDCNHTSDIEDYSSSDFDSSDSDENSENFSSGDEEIEKSKYKKRMAENTLISIEKDPKLFLGIPKKSFFLIKLLVDRSKLPVSHIYIVLKKIRLHPSFAILAIDFGLSSSSVCRIFSKSLPVIASQLQDLIVWPEVTYIQAHLPIPFRARYSQVISIIDCFEIEIEKPSDSISQALTWSKYYNCNTLKYLVSCTPDGLVTFISDGFGGRASDVVIVENSGYLNKLIPGKKIMADRGFKNISNLLLQKNCTLVRPPSVSSVTKSTKVEVKESKRIAALRIHVERVIRRLREFKMLSPHACIDRKHTSVLDYAVIIACGIINLQDHLIKS